MANQYLTETQRLERDRVALKAATTQPEIAKALDAVGFTNEVVAEGQSIFNTTRYVYDQNKREDKETVVSYAQFSGELSELKTTYHRHRRFGKIAFEKDSVILNNLDIIRSTPQAYISFMEVTKTFYSSVIKNDTMEKRLAMFRITPEELVGAYKQIGTVETARVRYLEEVAESQAATDKKDRAFATLDDWMSVFYKVSKIALEHNPQLLEVMGIVVRN